MEKPLSKFIAVHYQLYTVVGDEKVLEEQTIRERPFEFVSGFGVALEAFEKHIIDLEKGAEFDFLLQPEEAFGVYDPEGVHKLKRELFMVNNHFDHDNIFEGAVITLMDAENQRFLARVKKVDFEGVTVDTNHPLAGKVLNFTGEIIENREATREEVLGMLNKLSHEDECGCGECHDHEHGECSCGHCHS